MVAPIIPGHFGLNREPRAFADLDNRKKAEAFQQAAHALTILAINTKNTRALTQEALTYLKSRRILRLLPPVRRIIGALTAIEYNLTPPNERPATAPKEITDYYGPTPTIMEAESNPHAKGPVL